MPTTIQYYPEDHAPPRSVFGKALRVLVRNSIRRGEWGRRKELFYVFQGSGGDFMSRLQAMLDHVCLHGGVFHLWGHSWELERFDGWRQLDEFLRYAAERIPVEGRLNNRELLQHAAAHPLSAEFEASLPILGVDGSVKKRLRESAAASHAHLKTGTLEGVKTLAGYVRSQGGKEWVVVFLINHPNAKYGQAAQDALIEWGQRQ